MKRTIINKIEKWNESGELRKPLILMGARQVGKTWLMQTFAKAHYPNDTVFVDLHDNEALCDAIEESRADALGILGAMSDLPQQVLIRGNELFTHFKGAFTEQYVLNELVAAGVSPSYWSADEGMAEVEFVVQGATAVYPIEAKAERNLQAKSLKSYRDRFMPRKCLRTSLSERNVGEIIDDIPLYAVSTIVADYLG